MEKRFILFLVIAFAILMANAWIQITFFPPAPKDPAVAKKEEAQKPKDEKARDVKDPDKDAAPPAEAAKPADLAAPVDPLAPVQPGAAPAEAPVIEEQRFDRAWHVLGSLDPDSPYRMAVYISNQGAAIEMLELNSERYRDLEPHPGYSDTGTPDRSGYLGYLSESDEPGKGCRVNVVAPGTPAARAGLKPGDVITAFNAVKVTTVAGLHRALAETRPNQAVQVTIERLADPLTVTLAWRPRSILRPEKDTVPLDFPRPGQDPLSLLFTMHQVDSETIGEKEAELKDVTLRSGNWEILPGDEQGQNPDSIVRLRRVLPRHQLEIIKRYRLETVPAEHRDDDLFKAYHLTVRIEIRDLSGRARQVAYSLDGPTGLPIEGWWYGSKVTSTWQNIGLRDVMVQFDQKSFSIIGCPAIVSGDGITSWKDESLAYLAVDAQYFAAALLPITPEARTLADAYPVLAGKMQEGKKIRLANTSFRIVSKTAQLEPNGRLEHEYQFFAGPKKPHLLAQYGRDYYRLDSLVSYGWFPWVAKPMLWLLHTLYAVVQNYGIAILMLTVVVRLCLFPMSRKQALGAQKMQELQPEMKKIAEKHKGDAQARSRATQDLFRKHNYNPLGGCLLMFVQLPIFVGLYNSLRVDVELRQAPLFGEVIRWCSNLAAPDMLIHWESFIPAFFSSPLHGWLGPYLNVLPLVTISLFILQQKMFMPPPTDEQTAMQQKMMKYMMILMGFMFFNVPAGLCLYFIASSLWSIGEKKILPHTIPAGPPATGRPVGLATSSNGNAAPSRQKKKQRRK